MDLQDLVGKTIESINQAEHNTGFVIIVFTDNTQLTIDAEGDDMSHCVVEIDEP